jgi:hypothetical protein
MRDQWRRWTGAALLVVALGPAPAWAGRPLDTEDTSTVEPGKAEVEISGDFAQTPEDRAWLAKGVLSLGVVPRLEVASSPCCSPRSGRRAQPRGDR